MRMTLKELQSAFGHALRRGEATPPPADGPDYEDRFGVYRNNAWQFYAAALEQTYPVVQRRVGTDFFRQLAREYRNAHPSMRGDLHWVGANFPAWLAERMDSSAYEWLADLARLEWAVAQAAVAASPPSIDVAELASYAPEMLADLCLALHPSVGLVTSPYPVWHVWQANQQAEAEPIDLSMGGDCCVAACVGDAPATYRLDDAEYRVFERLARGAPLGAAAAGAGGDAALLGRVLAWAFAERLVTAIVSPSVPAAR